jgi:hypothetical protein
VLFQTFICGFYVLNGGSVAPVAVIEFEVVLLIDKIQAFECSIVFKPQKDVSVLTATVLELDTKKVVKHAVHAEWIVVILGLQHSHDGVDKLLKVYTASDGIFIY